MPDIVAIRLARACGVDLPPGAFSGAQDKQPQQDAQPPPPDPCTAFSGTLMHEGLPLPGSEAFCILADKVGDDFGTIGVRIRDWFDSINPIDPLANMLTIDKPDGIAGALLTSIIGGWNLAIESMRKFANDSVELLIKILQRVRDTVFCAFVKCNVPAYFGVWSLWQLMRILRELELGWELGPKLTIRVELDFPGVNEWLEALMRFYCPSEPPDPAAATEAWLLDRISTHHRDCIWKLGGLDPKTYEPFALTGREQLDWREAIQYARRLNLGDDAERAMLRSRGFVNKADADMAQEMFWELPGIADHLHWLQRQVFDADYVQRYDLMAGFEGKFWPKFGPDLTALGMRKQYAAWHYAAHWIQPAPQQMQEFLYRSDEIVAAGGKPFLLEDYERLLAEQDYAPLARKWFTATAYAVPAISYVKAMYQQGVIGEQELTTYHARLGYAPADAARFADIDRIQKARARASQTGGWTAKTASTAWVRGQLTADAHNDIFQHLGYTQAEASESRKVADTQIAVRIMVRSQSKALTTIATQVVSALKIGVMTEPQAIKALTDVGWNQEFAAGYVRTQSASAQMEVTKQGITFLRARVADGSITLDNARQQLTAFGVTAAAIERYLNLWRLQMTPARKHRSAAQIVSDLASGHIQTAEAVVRLRNLGYDDADSRLYLADAQGKVASIRSKKESADRKAMASRQKELQRQATAAAKLKKQLVSAMLRDMPVAKMEKWLKEGLLSKSAFTAKMRLYGFSTDDIRLRIASACTGKTAACQDTTPVKADTLPAGGSGGADAKPDSSGAK